MSSEAKIRKNKSIKKKIVIGTIITGVIITGGFMLLKDNNSVSEQIDVGPEIYSVPGKEKIFVNGKVIPVQSKDLFIDGDMGELDKINVDNGIKVEKGTSLFTCKNESIIYGKYMGKQWKQCPTLFWRAPKSLQMVTAAMKLKDAYSLEGKL